jgi:hypothetical protein
MISLKCDKHSLYNGAKLMAEQCDACSVIHAVNKLTHHVPDLERIQPIKLVTEPYLGLATTGELIDELRARAEVDGSISYKTVGMT